MIGIELVTYTTNYIEEDENKNCVVLTTEFCGDQDESFNLSADLSYRSSSRSFNISGRSTNQSETSATDFVHVASDVLISRSRLQDEDSVSLDSNTVAVDWDNENRSFYTIHRLDNREMDKQGYAKGYAMTLNNRVSAPSFTSYIDLEPEESNQDTMQISPDLLEGELCVSQADRVCSYSTTSGLTSGMSGTLFVTTLKLSLKLHIEDEQRQRTNKILAPWDIPLSSIYAIYEISGENSDKKKRLTLGSNIGTKVDGIFVVCKNFRFYRFSFKFAKIDQGRNVVNALLHHVRPKKSNLLFAFEQNVYTTLVGSGKPSSRTGWESVKHKSHVKNVRLTRANENWQISNSLPQQFIVPAHVTDEKLGMLSGLFLGNRAPAWVWGTPEGGAVFIQPSLNVLPSLQIDQLRNDFYGVHMGKKVVEIDLDKIFPSQSYLEDSYASMLEIHCMETEKEAEKMDSDYLSRIEGCGWLSTISTALRTSCEICEMLWRGETVVLVEGEGRGSGLIVASLVCILLEPEPRTRVGFEALVDNIWVSLGYPFSTNHQLCSPKAETSINPLFLIFLDAVFQLTEQFPSLFGFRREYLMDLWDTALLPVFDTFIFDSEHDRSMARRNPETPLSPSPAWNWESQFSEQYIKDWDNPLFGIPRRPDRNSLHDPSPSSMIMGKIPTPGVPDNKKYLPVNWAVASLAVWVNFFHRSVTFYQSCRSGDTNLLSTQRAAKQLIDDIYSTTRTESDAQRANHSQ